MAANAERKKTGRSAPSISSIALLATSKIRAPIVRAEALLAQALTLLARTTRVALRGVLSSEEMPRPVMSCHVICLMSYIMSFLSVVKARHKRVTKAGKKMMSGKEVVVKSQPAKTRRNSGETKRGRLTRVSNARSTSLFCRVFLI